MCNASLPFRACHTISHDWLADGAGLVLDSERSGFRSLWELDLDGNWRLLGARDAESPTLAGSKLAFKISQYESNIWSMDAATGQLSEQALISSTKYDTNPVWSPDGSEFAFSSNRTGRGGIWIAAADGSRERMVFEPKSGRSVWPVWSPDGSYLVATLYAESGQNLVRIALNHREVELIQTSGARPYAGAFSEDGRYVCFLQRDDLGQNSGGDALQPVILSVVRENENAGKDYFAGNQRVKGFLVGKSSELVNPVT